jgi:hypothetical protein
MCRCAVSIGALCAWHKQHHKTKQNADSRNEGHQRYSAGGANIVKTFRQASKGCPLARADESEKRDHRDRAAVAVIERVEQPNSHHEPGNEREYRFIRPEKLKQVRRKDIRASAGKA